MHIYKSILTNTVVFAMLIPLILVSCQDYDPRNLYILHGKTPLWKPKIPHSTFTVKTAAKIEFWDHQLKIRTEKNS